MSVSHLFQKGQSGNPGGVSTEHKRLVIDFRYECAREAYKRLPVMLDIIDNENIPANFRISAMNSLLDRGFGKPIQAIQVDGHPEDIPPQLMPQAQLNKYLEGNFFGAIEDMIETKNERFLSLIERMTPKKEIITSAQNQESSNKEAENLEGVSPECFPAKKNKGETTDTKKIDKDAQPK